MESLTPFEVEPCFCATQDGWEVPLYHLTPENRNSPHHPIILAHGLGTNRFNLAPHHGGQLYGVSARARPRCLGHRIKRGRTGPLQGWLTLLTDPKLRFHRLCEIRLTRPPRWPGSANPRNSISLGRAQHGAGWAMLPQCSTEASASHR